MNKRLRIKSHIVILILLVYTLISLVPFFWMLSTSLKGSGALMSIPIEWVPKQVSWDSYMRIFTKLPFLKSLSNSVVITLLSTFITLLSASMAAFIFAKFEFRFKRLLFTLFLGSMMIPIQVTGIPIFIILTKLNLTNTYLGVIAPSVFNVFAIFLLRQHMTNIPNAYIEAAVLDGAGFVKVFFKIIIPMSSIQLTTLFVINFMNYWNDYFWPLIILTDPDKMTLPVILSKMNSQYATEYNTLMAGAVVSLIPILLVYVFSQKYFIKGIQEGGIK